MAVSKIGVILFMNCFLKIFASYHWVVTENGRIQHQVEYSGFPLTKNDDLFALLEQEQRVRTVNRLYKELMSLKKSIDQQWSEIEGEGDLEKRLYSTDIDCILGKMPLSQHNLNTEFLDYGFGSRPKMKDNFQVVQPNCTAYSKLDFSMRTFPHLETLNKRDNYNLTVNYVPSNSNFNFNVNIDAMLKQNSSDWTAYNIASFYWRTMGNGSNALECARRAVYFSPRKMRYLALLNLGTLLQELQTLGEAAIILHSAVDHDPVRDISHLALGNVYAALGDYKRSLACYENVLSLNPGNTRALQLKHALVCHKKLELGLLEIHSSLQKILQDLQKHNEMQEEWLYLQNQINWGGDAKIKEFFSSSQPIYLNLKMFLQNVEHQAKTLNEEVGKKVPKMRVSREFDSADTKSEFDCSDESSLVCLKKREKKRLSQPEFFIENLSSEEESELENLIPSEYYLKSEKKSFGSLIESDEKEIEMNDREKEAGEELNHFSIDRSLLLSDMNACLKDSNNVKKLN